MSTSLPSSWAVSEIGSLCDLKNGRAFKPTEWSLEGLPIVRIQNLNNPNASFNCYSGEYENKYFLKGGELLFAWSGTPGTSFGAHVWRGGEALLNQHIFRVDFDDSFLDRRLFRHAINQKLNDLIGKAHGGAGLQHVTKGKFEATQIVVPPRNEQRRIADKLDTILTRVDVLNDRLARITPLLKRFRQSVLAAATSGRLTEDCAFGEVKRCLLKNIIKVSSGDGLVAKNMNSEGNIPVYGGNGVNGYHDRFNVYEPTIVIGRVGYYCGSVYLTPKHAWVTDNALKVKFDSEILDKNFLYFSLLGINLRENISSTAQPVISGQKIYSLVFRLPSYEEQAEIVRRVEILFAYADRLEARLQTARTAADRLTPALLAKAFRGELVPQDPNDEPATELLRRLREARAAQAPAKKTRGRKASAA
ncbi:restriction endonuclease subunit S [Comamonas sp. GB3 AK4-5]|uniref:restriction endonuclease subunit S n=1 Tax=Comamonas sp. GB3 AK4-5 TaxID=3231487 RepID=UPI00351DDD03